MGILERIGQVGMALLDNYHGISNLSPDEKRMFYTLRPVIERNLADMGAAYRFRNKMEGDERVKIDMFAYIINRIGHQRGPGSYEPSRPLPTELRSFRAYQNFSRGNLKTA